LGTLVSIAAVSGLGWSFDASAEKVNKLSTATGMIARKAVGDNAPRVTVYFSRPEHLPPEWRRRARSVRATLRTLQPAGAKLDLAWIPPEDLSQAEREQMAQSGVTPMRLTSHGEEVTSTRTFYSTIRLASRDRTELVHLNDGAAFEQANVAREQDAGFIVGNLRQFFVVIIITVERVEAHHTEVSG
jgi:hypothetical protein